MVTTFLSLGSNLGDRLAHLMRAVRMLRQLGTLSGYSRLYTTDPILYSKQPDFLNCAVRLETAFTPAELLREVKAIEQRLGRTFTVEKGPREIDIDISLYGHETINAPDLTIPHPGVTQRDFVIRTLLDIDPTLTAEGRPLSVRTTQEFLPSAFVSCMLPGLPLIAQEPSSPAAGVCEEEMPSRLVPPSATDVPYKSTSSSEGAHFPRLRSRPLLDCGEAESEFTDCSRQVLELEQRTLLIGLVFDVPSALQQLSEGADVLELTGVKLLRELRRDDRFAQALLCVPATQPRDAEEAIAAGADIVRDESAGACAAVCELFPCIHTRTPHDAADRMTSIAPEEWAGFNAALDTAFGLLPSEEQNWKSLRTLEELRASCPLPLVVSVQPTSLPTLEAEGSLAVAGAAAQAQVAFVRTSDVARTRRYLRAVDRIYRT